MNQQTCNPAWLDAFLKNELNESEEQMLTSHLDECSDCREELESRAAEQSVWREASNLLGGGILLSTAAISDIRSGTVRSPQIELVLQQLAPTDDPESLGRIGGYEVTGVVGAGGMGVVLKAHDRSLDRIVAIKVMSPHLASSGSARRRFAREAKAAAAVLHPNVIAIHSVASEDVNPFLVMPYVRGASLQKRIDSQGPLPLKDTLRIGAQIAAGLAAAHEQGLVHRDIKPANILLEEGVERVTITDFGLARAVDDASMTCSGVIAGTPQYMSPEQTRGEPIDARSDLFSLGSVLYAMCAGRSPFRAETTYGVLHRIANDNPTPVCEVNTDVPVWLGQIIERLMAKRPEDRFESAAQVAELLEGCLAHVQQPAAIPLPEAVAALAPKKTRRPPIVKFIAAAAGAIALFFAGVLIVLELDKGTLTIESEIDDVPIRIMQGEKVVKQLTVTKSGNSLRVAAGTYQIEIAGEFPLVSVANGIVSMRRGDTETVTIAMTPSTTANTKGEPVSSDLSPASTRLVADVIKQFNELQKSDPVGSKQPLLTDDEVIAAVRAMSSEIANVNVTQSNYEVLRDAIERGQIPKEWTVESSNHFKLSDGRVGERWTVQLSLRRGESSPQNYVFRSRYVKIEPEASGAIRPMPEGHVSIAEWLAKVNEPDLNIYAPLPDLPVTEQEIVAALADLIDKDQSTEFAPQRKTLQDIIETRSLPKEAEISVFRPKRLRGYVSRWSNREGFENENWRLRFEYPYMQGEKQIVTAVHLGFRSINSRPVDHVADDEIHWGPAAKDGLQFGVAIEEVTLADKSDLASAGAIAYKPHFYFRNPSKTDSTSIQLSDMYQHYEIDARTATGEQLPSKRRQGSYRISRLIFPDTLNGESRIYKHASPFVVGTYAKTLFEDSLSLEPPDRQSFESFPSVAVNSPLNTPLRIRISIPHPLFSDSARLLSGEIRLPPLQLTQTNADTAEGEKAKDEAAKAWLRRPVVGSTHDGKSFQLAGHDALMHCVMTNNSEALNRLLTVDKYDLDYCPLHGQWTLLQTALQRSCLGTTSLLLQHGANPTFASKGTPLPLELAKRSGRKELVTLVQKYLESNAPHSQSKATPGSRVSDDREVSEPETGLAEKGESTGSLPLLPRQFEELVKTIQQLGPSATYEEFIKATKVDKGGGGCDEHSSSGVSRSRFTWWMEDGYSLHALIDEHPHSITNRFSCAGISKSGKLIWIWANNPDDLHTIDGLELREAARDCRPSSGEENSSKGSIQKTDSELVTGQAAMLNVAIGETDDLRLGQSYKIDLLVLASDDLKPVAGASVDVILIEDYKGVTGDGGFAGFKTNEKGIATVDNSLWPGRYQIRVRAPEGSRFRDTEFAKGETILVVHEDGRYSPREFRLAVKDEN
ncbi:MAG: Serine/threonine-protein kinase PknB [Planctomycetota bacterium]|jgi:serine/threonine protein kinase/ankyrin repeat protein